ncbi:SMI1/KNR4 family protein [Chitinimonas lacunae]|uniref:SMI1/KNR4 family protein n=1 Tax=Chitinimonas lacunae TaxID=1963018 RepID=A0ABV8MP73_9NEIS
MYKQADFKKWLIAASLCPKNAVQGVPEDKIVALEVNTGLTLPTAYKDFLRDCGSYAGDFAPNLDFLYFSLPFIQEDLADQLASGAIAPLPATAFCFMASEGQVFNYFLCEGEDDPPVYQVVAGRKEIGTPYPTLSAFMRDLMALEQRRLYPEPDTRWLEEE